MINRLLLGVALAAVAGLVQPAAAADLPMRVKAPPMVVPDYFSWNGFYVGVNVGYSWGRGDTDLDSTSTTTTRTRVFRTAGPTLISDVTTVTPLTALTSSGRADINGWVGGGQIGYNWTHQSLLFGLEADIQGSGQRGSHTFCLSATVPCPAAATTITLDQRLNWFGTVRGRLGVLVHPRVLLYGTGGLAYGEVESDFTTAGGGFAASNRSFSQLRAGYTVGGGVEGAFWDRWSLKAEYLFIDLGRIRNDLGSSTFATSTNLLDTPSLGFNTLTESTTTGTFASRTRFTDHIFRVGLNYRFSEPTVVARY